MSGGDFRAQLPSLCAQHRAFALHVHESQFAPRAIRQDVADRALVPRSASTASLEPGAQVTEHRAILGGERHAEIAAALLRRARESTARRPRPSSFWPPYTRAQGVPCEIVVVVRRGAAGAARRPACARDGWRRLRRPWLRAPSTCAEMFGQDGKKVFAASASQARGQQLAVVLPVAGTGISPTLVVMSARV